MQKHIRIGLIVEDKYCSGYKVFTEKVRPDAVRGYPLGKNKTIPAGPKLRVWIEQCRNKFDFVFVLIDLDTPAHHKDPDYFDKIRHICIEEGAALLVVKRELESWILADVKSIACWKLGDNATFSFSEVYPNSADKPWEPKKEILKLVQKLVNFTGKKTVRSFDPGWIGQMAEKVELCESVLRRNCSLKCFHDLVKGCSGDNNRQYFDSYPQEKHCNRPELP